MEFRANSPKRGGEIGMSEKKIAENGSEVVVVISEQGASRPIPTKDVRGSNETTSSTPKHVPPLSSSSPELAFATTHNRPPRVPNSENVLRNRTFNRSVYSKPKSRFGEQPAIDLNAYDEKISQEQGAGSPLRPSSNRPSPARNVPITPKTPLMASPGGIDEDEEIYKRVNSQLGRKKSKRVRALVLIECTAFVFLMGCLISSLAVHKVRHFEIWSLEVWKWCVLVLVTFCGMLCTRWFMLILVFLIERNFLLKKKVLYFVHGLKKSVQVFVWLALVLVTWVSLFKHGVERSETATKVLNFITWSIVTLLIGSFLWLVKNLLLKLLASTFHVNTFFDRIQESVFHQYVLQTLSGPPFLEMAEKVGRIPSTGQLSFTSDKKGKEKTKKEIIDMGKLHQMKKEKVSAWTMKVLVDVISNSGLSTISNTLDSFDDGAAEKKDKEITDEMEAIAAAYHIFRNVAPYNSKYIDEEDLMRFMIKEEVDLVFPLFEGAETGRIDRKALTNWVVKVYQGRKALAHALTDTKTAVKQLNKLVTGILCIVIVVIWLLLMEIATTKVLVLLSSQLVVAAFMFGNTCKTIFESIIFVFVMHPFDVGDRCVIDGVQMIVEEMNILTTVFLRYDNEKIYYPNSVLSTKPISNFFRSPDMGDSTEFSIDFKTPLDKFSAMKEKIKKFLERNPQHWHPGFNLVVKEREC
uniref:Mechanosensitive ion channel protein n=1 Tax=Kalanchoe fedtschenkoi TaxID=63787 RepID=A0A7N0V3A7_KALFE